MKNLITDNWQIIIAIIGFAIINALVMMRFESRIIKQTFYNALSEKRRKQLQTYLKEK